MPGLGLQAAYAGQALNDTLEQLTAREAATRLQNAELSIKQQEADTQRQRAQQDYEEHLLRMQQMHDQLTTQQNQQHLARIMSGDQTQPLNQTDTDFLTNTMGMQPRTQATGVDWSGQGAPAVGGMGITSMPTVNKINLRPLTEAEAERADAANLTPEQLQDRPTLIRWALSHPGSQATIDELLKPKPPVKWQSKEGTLNGNRAFADYNDETRQYFIGDQEVTGKFVPTTPPSQQPPTEETVQSYIRQMKSGATTFNEIPGAMTKDAVMRQLNKEGYDIALPIPAQIKEQAGLAKGLLPLIDNVKTLAEQVQQAIPMGTIGGRLRSWAGGESVGADLTGLTPAQSTLVGKFITEAGLLKSGVAKAHGGARGGGSITMLESLNPLLDPGNKDINTYLGNLAGARDFMDHYAQQGQQPGLTGGPETAPPAGAGKGGGPGPATGGGAGPVSGTVYTGPRKQMQDGTGRMIGRIGTGDPFEVKQLPDGKWVVK